MKHRYSLLTIPLLAVIIAGCQDVIALWIEPGSTASNLAFNVAETKNGPALAHRYSMTVYRCPPEGGSLPSHSESLWHIYPRDAGDVPLQIRYGQAPDGYQVLAGPSPLVEGCYIAVANGQGTYAQIRFSVDASGAVGQQ